MNDDFLNQFREPPRSEFAASLYKRISKPMITQPYAVFRRRLALTFTALAVALTLILIASPDARAFAQTFLRQIGVLTLDSRPVGEHVIVAPPSAEQMAQAGATATPIPPASQSAAPLERAIAEAGFLPYLPGYLPDGFSQVSIAAAEYLDDQQINLGTGIFADYRSEIDGYLSIQTSRFDGREQSIPTGGLSITDVSVNGQSGVWIEGLPFESSLTPSCTVNMLLWQEGDFVLAIQADQLSLEEVLKIAEGLKQ